MGHRIMGAGGGSEGSGGFSEEPDDLSSVATARFVDLLGEGPIQGLVNGEFSIYLDRIPLRDLSGTPNYKPFKWHATPGTQNQGPLPGFTGTEQEVAVGVQLLKSQGRVVRAVSDAEADAARVTVAVNGLNFTSDKGALLPAGVNFTIWKRVAGGTWVAAVPDALIKGKTGSKYQRSYEIPLADLGPGPYEVGVERLTNDSTSALINDNLYWDGLTVINYEKFTYPNSALVGVEIDARYFGSVPERSYHVRGLIVRVPTNYDPEKRTYSGIWDGTFKLAYTNNPAWCFYDLVTHPRYGLGKRIDASQINKWDIYSIGRYCDEMVPTGTSWNVFESRAASGITSDGSPVAGVPQRTGNVEPRFTLNCVLNTREDAYRVLNQLSSVFRGMVYWGAGQIAITQDRPGPVSALWTNANVIDGMFNYEGSGRAQRHTTATIAWNDPAEDFKQKFVYVEDRDGIARYGIRNEEQVAFGCTSKSQARRLGLWILYTERLEREAVRFKVGLDSAHVQPGDIGKVLDSYYVGKRWGGRLLDCTTTTVELDAPVTLIAGTYNLSCVAKDGTVTERVVNIGSAGSFNTLTVTVPFAEAPKRMAIWVLGSTEVRPRLVRVISIKQESATTFEITAIDHDPSKYAAIELGVPPEGTNYSFLDIESLGAVANLKAEENGVRSPVDGTAKVSVLVSWDAIAKATLRGYVVTLKSDTARTLKLSETTEASVQIDDLDLANWTITVYAVDVYGRYGPGATVLLETTGASTYVVPEVENLSASLEVDDANKFRIFARWRAVDYPGHARTEVYRVNASENQILQMIEAPGGEGSGTRIKFGWTVANPTPEQRLQAILETTNTVSVKLLYSGTANECLIDDVAVGDCTLLAVNRTNIGEYSSFACWKYVEVSDEEAGGERPPTPVGFNAAAVGMSGVIASWSTPTYTEGGGHRQTNIYAVRKARSDATVPVFADAARVASADHPILQVDFLGPGSSRWHVWAKWMTKKGAESAVPAGGTHGIEVETEADVEAIIDLLDGNVSESMLDQSLRDKIEKIELIDTINGDETITGSIAWNRAQETNARALAIDAEVLARTDADNVLFTSLTTGYTNAANGAYTAARSYVQGYSFSKTESTESLAALSNSLTTGYTSYADGRYSAAINYVNSYSYSIANANSAINASANALRSEFQAGDNNLLNTVNATLSTNYYTQAQANQATAAQIAEAATRVGGNYEAVHTWEFRFEANNWFVHQGTITPHQNSIVYAVQGFDSHLVVIFPSEVNGNIWEKVRMRLRHFGGSIGSWEGNVYYATAGHAWDNQYRKQIPKPATIDTGGGWLILEWDMTALTAGGNDYLSSMIYGLRFDLVNDNSGNPVFEIDWVSVGRYGPGTSATRIATIEQSVSSGDAALAQQITVVQGQVTTGDANLLGVIQSERQIAIDREQVIAQTVTTLQGTVTSNQGQLLGIIQDERSLSISREQVIANAVTTLQGTVTTNNNTLTGAIQTEQNLRVTGDEVNAQAIQTLQATVNGNTASIQQEATVRAEQTGALFAQYTVKVSTGGLLSGFGLSSEDPVDDEPSSTFAVLASRFYIGSPTGTGITPVNPFYVQTVPTTINDEPVPVGVYITNAFIAKGSITSAHIGDLSANKIKTGFLDTARLAANSVTADKINTTDMHVRGKISGGAITGWPNWGPAGSTGFYLGPEGFMMGSLASNQYVAIGSNGEFYAPGFTITAGGNAVFSGTVAANVIRTNSIVGGDISRTAASSTSGNEISVSITLEHPADVSMTGTVTIPFQGPGGQYMRINGSQVRGETVVNGVVCTLCYAMNGLGPGTHTFTMGASNAGAMNAFIQVIATMR